MRQRPVRSGGSGGSGRTDWTMWVVQSDEDGDGRTKMGTNPDRWSAELTVLKKTKNKLSNESYKYHVLMDHLVHEDHQKI